MPFLALVPFVQLLLGHRVESQTAKSGKILYIKMLNPSLKY